MDFKIKENVTDFNFFEDFWKNIFGWLIIICGMLLLPFIVIYMFFVYIYESVFKKKTKSTDEIIVNEWKEILNSDEIKLFRKQINDDEVPDFIWEMDIDNDVYAFQIKTEPELKILDNLIFDCNELETDKGFYLISFDKNGEKMSLWFIDKISLEVKIVTKLEPMWWDLEINETKISLKGSKHNKEYNIEIEEIKK